MEAHVGGDPLSEVPLWSSLAEDEKQAARDTMDALFPRDPNEPEPVSEERYEALWAEEPSIYFSLAPTGFETCKAVEDYKLQKKKLESRFKISNIRENEATEGKKQLATGMLLRRSQPRAERDEGSDDEDDEARPRRRVRRRGAPAALGPEPLPQLPAPEHVAQPAVVGEEEGPVVEEPAELWGEEAAPEETGAPPEVKDEPEEEAAEEPAVEPPAHQPEEEPAADPSLEAQAHTLRLVIAMAAGRRPDAESIHRAERALARLEASASAPPLVLH